MNNSNIFVKFSEFFIKKWRLSILLLVSITVLGYFAYTNVLKRESMPPIEVPMGVIVSPYFVNDTNIVNEKITKPLENVIGTIPEVNKVSSETSENFSTVTVSFNQGVTSKEGMNLIKQVVTSNTLPAGVTPNYIIIEASKFDGLHDLLIPISGKDKTLQEIQTKGTEIANKLQDTNKVSKVEVINAIKTEQNPITGESITYLDTISRLGVESDGKLNFIDAVYLGINRKNSDVGTIELSDAMHNEIKSLQEQGMLDGYTVTFSSGDPAIALQQQIDNLQSNAVSAAIIVLVIILILVNWRASLISVIFIISVLAATALTFVFIGYSINTMTLFALILVLGLFVDDAIVVIEAIDAQKQAGLKGMEAVKRAILKVGVADTIGTFTTMLVFVPMALISGIMGDFIRIMPVTVILALALSLAIALSIIPFLSYKFLAEKNEKKPKNLLEKFSQALYLPGLFVTDLGRRVSILLDKYLQSFWLSLTVVVVSIALVIFGLVFAAKVPFTIFPPAKDGENIMILYTMPEGTTIEKALENVKKIETIMQDTSSEFKTVNYISTNEKSGYIYAELTSMKTRKTTSGEIVKKLNSQFGAIKELRVKAEQPSAGPISDDYAFQIQIYSEDPVVLKNATNEIKTYLLSLKLAEGIKVEDVLISNLISIGKNDGQRFALIKAKITASDNQSGNLQTLIKDVKDHYTTEEMGKIGLGEKGIGYDLGMESEMMGSFNSALVGLMISLVVMYAILVIQFDSFTQPFLVFLGIPFSFILLFPGLKATDNPMSFFVLLGITALTGILANNIIMLLDFAKRRAVEEKKNPREAIVGAVKRRFRPLVATSLITISGLLPLAISDPFWSALALSIIFGLIACTTMVIFVLPVYYVMLENSRLWVKLRLGKLVHLVVSSDIQK
ncbi:MAG: efflux RND transporter permease subunit [bacterium]